MKGNLAPNPFAHLMPSERGNDVPELNTYDENGNALVKVWGTWYTEKDAEIQRQGNHDYCQARRDERAKSSQRAAEQRKADDESFKWLMRGDPGAAYGFDEPTSAPVRVYRDENELGDVATSIGYWVFFLIIFAGCVFGIISSL